MHYSHTMLDVSTIFGSECRVGILPAAMTIPTSWPKVIKLFSYSTHLSIKFFLLINAKIPTIVGILIFISRKNFMLSSAVQKEKLIAGT